MIDENVGLREGDAKHTHNDVVLLLVEGKPNDVEAFAKRVNVGSIELDDHKKIVIPEVTTQAELDKLFGTINIPYSEMIGRRIPDVYCESLRERGERNKGVCPGFYKLIDACEGYSLGDKRGVACVNYSEALRVCLKKRLLAKGRLEHSSSNIPIGL